MVRRSIGAVIIVPLTIPIQIRFQRTGKRSDIFLATKFGLRSGVPGRPSNGDPAYVRESCERSLQRLGVDQIDLYYFHRYACDISSSAMYSTCRCP